MQKYIRNIHGKDSFVEVSKNLVIDLKIILFGPSKQLYKKFKVAARILNAFCSIFFHVKIVYLLH